MSLERLLPPVPDGFEVARGARGVVWARADAAGALARAGFGPDGTCSEEALPDADESGREPLGLLDLGGRSALVRRFVHGGLARRLTGRVFRDPTRAFRELRASEALRALGIPTPSVLAARAVSVRGGYELSLVVERLAGTRDVGRLFGDVRAGRAPKGALRRALVDVGRLISALHGVGFHHADLQPANVLVRSDGERGAVVLDLDRSVFMTPAGEADVPAADPVPLPEARRAANLGRLWRHVRRREERYGAVLDERDLALFLSAYGLERTRIGGFGRAVDAAADRRGALHRFGWWLERSFGRRDDARARG
ncbi:MAG: lipopolysaccharide kinase InaA family protein [Planctomycetota bacterium]